jgi:hypothetical protein
MRGHHDDECVNPFTNAEPDFAAEDREVSAINRTEELPSKDLATPETT